jgi:hypothetical protein
MDAMLEWLVHANVKRLTQACAPARDVDDLDSQLKNLGDDRHHHVALVCIKKDDWLNARRHWVHHKLWAEDLVEPEHHALLIHPCSILASVDGRRVKFGQFFFSIIPLGLPLKIIIGIKKLPAAVMVNTHVALFVPFDVLWI